MFSSTRGLNYSSWPVTSSRTRHPNPVSLWWCGAADLWPLTPSSSSRVDCVSVSVSESRVRTLGRCWPVNSRWSSLIHRLRAWCRVAWACWWQRRWCTAGHSSEELSPQIWRSDWNDWSDCWSAASLWSGWCSAPAGCPADPPTCWSSGRWSSSSSCESSRRWSHEARRRRRGRKSETPASPDPPPCSSTHTSSRPQSRDSWFSPNSAEGDDDAPQSWGWSCTPAPVLPPWMPSGHKHKSHDHTVIHHWTCHSTNKDRPPASALMFSPPMATFTSVQLESDGLLTGSNTGHRLPPFSSFIAASHGCVCVSGVACLSVWLKPHLIQESHRTHVAQGFRLNVTQVDRQKGWRLREDGGRSSDT